MPDGEESENRVRATDRAPDVLATAVTSMETAEIATAETAWINSAPMALEETFTETFTLRRIRRILNESRDTRERRQAAEQLLPHLWSRFPWQRYQAGCVLTTRVYLPGALMLLEWGSFPNVLMRELRRKRYGSLPAYPEEQREALIRTLGDMLTQWQNRYLRLIGGRRGEAAINMDVAADVCEAIGRLGIAEAEKDLLEILKRFRNDNNQVRMAALMALAALPPERLHLTWGWLRYGSLQESRLVASALAYMVLPEAVPFLLDALPRIAVESDLQQLVGIPLLQALGRIGDPRALPALNVIARHESHPLQPGARKAIQRIMKEAQGHEEVTLVRASGASSLYDEVLLRPSAQNAFDAYPEQLLRATTAGIKATPPENTVDEVPEGRQGESDSKTDRAGNNRPNDT